MNMRTSSTSALLPLEQGQKQGCGWQVPAPVTIPSSLFSAFAILISVTQRGFVAEESLNQTGANLKRTEH